MASVKFGQYNQHSSKRLLLCSTEETQRTEILTGLEQMEGD